MQEHEKLEQEVMLWAKEVEYWLDIYTRSKRAAEKQIPQDDEDADEFRSAIRFKEDAIMKLNEIRNLNK